MISMNSWRLRPGEARVAELLLADAGYPRALVVVAG